MIIGSLSGLLFIDSECEAGEWAQNISQTWFWPASIFVGWLIIYRSEVWHRSLSWKLSLLIASVVFGWIYAFVMLGYPLWINALTASGETVQVHGPVVDKKKGSTRYTGWDYFLTIQFNGRTVCLEVSQEEYNRRSVGSFYGREMQRGGFGYFYRW